MSAKKIGITTFHRAHNYGAILQAYALQETLKKLGYKPEIIDYYNSFIYNQYKVIRPLQKSILSSAKTLAYDIFYLPMMQKRAKAFNNVINGDLILSKKVLNKNEVEKLKYDAIITGSDQVWNINIVGSLDDIYTLNLDNDIKKISYAASVGEDHFITDNKEEYRDKLKRINHVSVREENTAPVLSKVLNKDIDVVLDPSLLRDKKEWEQLIDKNRIIKEKYIFAYSVGTGSELFYKAAQKIAEEKNLEIIYFEQSRKNRFGVKAKNYYKAGPREFLNLLYYSDYVVTSSFHGLAFSTIFNKEISVVLSNKPERLVTLMKKAGLSERTVTTVKNINTEKISWDKVNKKIAAERERSIKWLSEAIER